MLDDRSARELRLACWTSDRARIEALIDARAELVFDELSGAQAVHGVGPIADRLLDLLGAKGGNTVRDASVNGHAGLALVRGSVVAGVVSLGWCDGRIRSIWVIQDPEKLHGFNRRPVTTERLSTDLSQTAPPTGLSR